MAGFKALRFAGHFLLCGLLILACQNVIAAGTAKNYDQRIKQLERLMQNRNLLEMLNQLQSLQREVSDLRGELELLNHNQSEIKQQQKDIYLDIDQRIQNIDQQLASGLMANAPATVMNSFPDDDQNALNEQEGYQSALTVLKAGRYEEAIEAFQIYLITFPASEYASNAQYWMAEAYYVLKDYQSAISQFNKVIIAYPGSRKVPDAFLKMGFSYYELKDWSKARKTLETIMIDFGKSTAARLADRRLQKMKQNGLI